MAELRAIVVVPTEAGRALWGVRPALRIPPDLNARVAQTRRGRLPTVAFWGDRDGLPLWWDGVPVPLGVFAAWHAWCPRDDASEFEATGWTTYDVLAEALESASAAEWLARSLERAGRGRVVLLDLVDGAVVERAP